MRLFAPRPAAVPGSLYGGGSQKPKGNSNSNSNSVAQVPSANRASSST
ncbi:hypothetical protein STPYR_11671 [uncultured Stenotrophomonas sp.]|uniref:Uncharacterized protein n=1 Tax=uncultured Stenotrophomonas sp. TaxID=165438 RepID=A0A1Y5Q3B8_9GAMM|nr:hypothetical protein STPYR_11671 [uncultured Stenotrophomonas sp.]